MKTERIRGSAWMSIRARILQRDTLCVVCLPAGRVRVSVEVDHRIPLHMGGSNDDDNLQGVCIEDHALKTAHERGVLRRGCDADGLPTDPMHPWNAKR